METIRRALCRLLCLVAVLWPVAAPAHEPAGPLAVIYPQPESEADTRDNDLVELIRLALEATVDLDGPFSMRPSATPMRESRYRFELKEGANVNIVWSTVTEELEQEFLPIRFPVRKGILGYRIFLIDEKNQDLFANIDSLDALRALRVGQGEDWNDVDVFKANGFRVVTGTDYEGLFKMLMAGRFDYFSRGINEAPDELAARAAQYPDMRVETNILLYYPWPKYFFVGKSNERLAGRIETGLRRLMQNGSYDRWFYTYHQAAIEVANLKDRRLFRIDNPLLPDSVPLDQAELWYAPFSD